MPISGRLHFLDRKLAYVETGLTVGAEKQKSVFKKGDLGFMVSNGSICIVLQDTKGINMNHIGHCVEDPILLESSDSGEIIFINRTPWEIMSQGVLITNISIAKMSFVWTQ